MKLENEYYTTKAKKVVNKYNLKKYVHALVNHWKTNSYPSLGHGFGHVLEVAVEGFELAQLNKYTKPEELFIAGLYHDVYRPAEGKDGSEDHHLESFTQAINILSSIGTEKDFINKFQYALSDKWKESDQVDDFSQLLFLADKSALTTEMADAYAWASNKHCIENSSSPAYPTALSTLRGFVHYSDKILAIVIKIDMQGKEKVVSNFVELVNHCESIYLKDPDGVNYQQYLNNRAIQFADKERVYLRAFEIPEDTIDGLIEIV